MTRRWRSRAAARRHTVLRRRVLAALTFVAVVALATWASVGGSPARPRGGGHSAPRGSSLRRSAVPDRFAVTRLTKTLPFALQDAACAYLGSDRVALLGGLDATDTSTARVILLAARGVRRGGLLPEPQHDAQGALLDGRVFVFGGGQFGSYDHILAYDPASERVSEAASLPAPTSDAAVAAIAGTAYVIGGYDGERALDTIVAWRPGEDARAVAALPHGLRYAAVAASGGRLVIAGGSQEEAATRAILSFDPSTGVVAQIGELPVAVTHATAVALGRYVYVLGGRGSAPGSQRAAVVAIDATTGHSLDDGSLPVGLSDACAVSSGERIWLIGGVSPTGTVASVLQLRPVAP